MSSIIQYQNGQKVGKCTFLEIVPKPEGYNAPKRFALFICECGNFFEATIDHVKNRGDVCQECHYNKVSIKKQSHGESKHRDRVSKKEFNSWVGMKGRCYNPKNQKFHIYGGRGIVVCDRWLESYENFLEDMGRAPSPNHSLDRIDVNGNYCKENCRWATAKQQSRNQQKSIKINFKGEIMHLFDVAELIGLTPTCLYQRIYRHGWDLERALNTPLKKIRA